MDADIIKKQLYYEFEYLKKKLNIIEIKDEGYIIKVKYMINNIDKYSGFTGVDINKIDADFILLEHIKCQLI